MTEPRRMRLPKSSQHPQFIESHVEDEWCVKLGCLPVIPTEPQSAERPTAREFLKTWKCRIHDKVYCLWTNCRAEFAEAYARAAAPAAPQSQQTCGKYAGFDLTCAKPEGHKGLCEAKPAEQVTHKTVRIKVWADIDEEIAPIVERLNEIPGVTTHASCQGQQAGPKPYGPYVMISWVDDSVKSLLQREFNLKEEGENWGYAHPRLTP